MKMENNIHTEQTQQHLTEREKYAAINNKYTRYQEATFSINLITYTRFISTIQP